MKSILAFFQRLQWKLTLSYAVVTAGTVIVLSTLLMVISLMTDNQVNSRKYNSFYWSKTAFQDNIPYLVEDRSALQSWLERVQSKGFAWTDFQSYVEAESLGFANTLVTGDQPIYVLDADLNLLAAAPMEDERALGQPFSARRMEGISYESILAAAQEGDKNYYAQSFTQPDGSYIAALPLRKTDEDPIAAIVIYTLKPTAFAVPSNLAIYTTFFIIISLVMLMVALPVGAVFGWIASFGLRGRLQKLSMAAKAWSKGDFSMTARDRSADEIGELTRDLNSMSEQLQTLIHTRDELARIEERNRLARDLHDTVKQQTYAARMQLSAAKNLLQSDPAAAAEHIEAALQLNRETQQELKLIIDELRPAALAGKGLAQAVAEYTARWHEHTGIKVEITVSGDRTLPLNVEQVLYRVLQESLSNIARHAEADQVKLTLTMFAQQVTLVISDNGRGFDPALVPPHSMGLVGMQQRLAEVGGMLKIESVISVGTRISANIPLQAQP
ncbi:MAG TPA: sensor histidine kinase [Anaerolineaceae bacterium]|nr:sensor histidine kinase [Anaerolineaceae bacterium]HPN52000.1 sensor histidine kinase [Anaerolineaceae bacterium]